MGDHQTTTSSPGDDIDVRWLGVMITYTEQDFPTAAPYQRTIPGWECRRCGQRYGTSGLPPRKCECET